MAGVLTYQAAGEFRCRLTKIDDPTAPYSLGMSTLTFQFHALGDEVTKLARTWAREHRFAMDDIMRDGQ